MTASRIPGFGPLMLLMLASMIMTLTACASDGGARAGQPASVSATPLGLPDAPNRLAAPGDSGDYRIGPQDLLEISVFQVADLNRTVRVNTGGDVSLPLIGAVRVGGRTVHEVETDIAAKLSKSFLQDPQVSVFVKEFTSQRVTLEGALQKPGIYPLTGQTSLLQAIAMAQGLSELADTRGILVFRMIDGKKRAAVFDLGMIRKGKAEDPLIYGDDIVVVEQSGSKSMFSKFVKAVPAFGIFTVF